MANPNATVGPMSTLLRFRSNYFRSDVNIQACLTLERQSRLPVTVIDRPWAAALQRLLGTVRRPDGSLWKKGDLAEAARVRPATISALLNSAQFPETKTLKSIADVFQVELWEFFVNDEQAAVLHSHGAQRRRLQADRDVAARVEQVVMTKLALLVKDATKEIVEGPSQPIGQPANPLPQPRPHVVPAPSRKRRR